MAPNINLQHTAGVGVTSAKHQSVQPFSTISLFMDPIFHSTMNSLQIGVHKQYSHGFMINAEYQWTRVTGNGKSGEPFRRESQRLGTATSAASRRRSLSSATRMCFRIGTGQALFGGAGNFVNKFIGGWQISGITSFQTGQPFSVTYTAPGSPVGLVSGRANVVPGVNLYPARIRRAPSGSTRLRLPLLQPMSQAASPTRPMETPDITCSAVLPGRTGT